MRNIINQMIDSAVEQSESKPTILHFLEQYRTNGQVCSHVSLIGGKWNVPYNMNSQFLDIYCRNARNKQYIVERPTEFYPIIIDIDLKYNCEKSEEFILSKVPEFLNIFSVSACDIFQNVDTDVYICSKNMISKNKKCYKHGLHVYFPNLVSNWETSSNLRNHILNREGRISLKMLFETINEDNDIFDRCMCRENPNGIRMPWSYKKVNKTCIILHKNFTSTI